MSSLERSLARDARFPGNIGRFRKERILFSLERNYGAWYPSRKGKESGQIWIGDALLHVRDKLIAWIGFGLCEFDRYCISGRGIGTISVATRDVRA
jgi:hypothetical protein